MRYLIIIEKTKTGFSAFSPDLSGCIATGSTEKEVEKNMREAIAFHLDGMHKEGLSTPRPHSFSAYYKVSASAKSKHTESSRKVPRKKLQTLFK